MLELMILLFLAVPVIAVFLKYYWDKEDVRLGLPGPPTKIIFGNVLELQKAAKKDGDSE